MNSEKLTLQFFKLFEMKIILDLKDKNLVFSSPKNEYQAQFLLENEGVIKSIYYAIDKSYKPYLLKIIPYDIDFQNNLQNIEKVLQKCMNSEEHFLQIIEYFTQKTENNSIFVIVEPFLSKISLKKLLNTCNNFQLVEQKIWFKIANCLSKINYLETQLSLSNIYLIYDPDKIQNKLFDHIIEYSIVKIGSLEENILLTIYSQQIKVNLQNSYFQFFYSRIHFKIMKTKVYPNQYKLKLINCQIIKKDSSVQVIPSNRYFYLLQIFTKNKEFFLSLNDKSFKKILLNQQLIQESIRNTNDEFIIFLLGIFEPDEKINFNISTKLLSNLIQALDLANNSSLSEINSLNKQKLANFDKLYNIWLYKLSKQFLDYLNNYIFNIKQIISYILCLKAFLILCEQNDGFQKEWKKNLYYLQVIRLLAEYYDNSYSFLETKYLRYFQLNNLLLNKILDFVFRYISGFIKNGTLDIYRAIIESGLLKIILKSSKNIKQKHIYYKLIEQMGFNSTGTPMHIFTISNIVYSLLDEIRAQGGIIEQKFVDIYSNIAHLLKYLIKYLFTKQNRLKYIFEFQNVCDKITFLDILCAIPLNSRKNENIEKILGKLFANVKFSNSAPKYALKISKTLINMLTTKKTILYSFLFSSCINLFLLLKMKIPYQFGSLCKTCSQQMNKKITICYFCTQSHDVAHEIVPLGFSYFTCVNLENNQKKISIEENQAAPTYLIHLESDKQQTSISEIEFDYDKQKIQIQQQNKQFKTFTDYKDYIQIASKKPVINLSKNGQQQEDEYMIYCYQVIIQNGGLYDDVYIGFSENSQYFCIDQPCLLQGNVLYNSLFGELFVHTKKQAYGAAFGSNDKIICCLTSQGNVYYIHNGIPLPLIKTQLVQDINILVLFKSGLTTIEIRPCQLDINLNLYDMKNKGIIPSIINLIDEEIIKYINQNQDIRDGINQLLKITKLKSLKQLYNLIGINTIEEINYHTESHIQQLKGRVQEKSSFFSENTEKQLSEFKIDISNPNIINQSGQSLSLNPKYESIQIERSYGYQQSVHVTEDEINIEINDKIISEQEKHINNQNFIQNNDEASYQKLNTDNDDLNKRKKLLNQTTQVNSNQAIIMRKSYRKKNKRCIDKFLNCTLIQICSYI